MFPLEKIKVVDLSEEIAGPFCSLQLSHAGAEVIKVEPLIGDFSRHVGPRIGDESSLFTMLNHGKKSIAVDLQQEKGREIVLKLAKRANIFIEGFRPGRVEDLKIDYQTIESINPRIIYSSITPFGEDGPYKGWSASELEVQGMAGLLAWIGELDSPPVRVGADIASTAAGMEACVGILAALSILIRLARGRK